MAELPTLAVVRAALAPLLGSDGALAVEREVNAYSSSFRSEVLRCRLPNETERRLLCKYSSLRPEVDGHDGHGSRGGVGYEGAVYAMLRDLPLWFPRFHGVCSDPATAVSWLVLEHIEGGASISKTPEAMPLAARWIGEFHTATSALFEIGAPLSFLRRHDADFYLGWVRRTLRFASGEFSWLPALCRRFEEVVPGLVQRPATVVHGEYVPKNILVQNGATYPIDWESAAIGLGELDLAMLTDDWPPETLQRCAVAYRVAYREARWPGGGPEDFERVLDAARLQVLFPWLGDRPEWTAASAERFRRLEALGRRLGLLP